MARHHGVVVERRHEDEAALGREFFPDRDAVFFLAIVENDLRAVARRVRDLERGRVRRHDDDGARTDVAGGGRHGLRVVAGGERDDAAFAFVAGQERQAAHRAAELERAGALQDFGFGEDAPAGCGRGGAGFDQGRAGSAALQSPCRRFDVGEGEAHAASGLMP